MSSGRDDILGRLRVALGRKGDRLQDRAAPTTATAMKVTEARGDRLELGDRFGESLAALSGSYQVVNGAADVADRVVELITGWSADDRPDGEGSGRRDLEVLSWAAAALTPPDLGPRLEQAGIRLVVPDELRDREHRSRAAALRVGLTAVDAAIASTGSVVLATGPGRSRAASLLPTHHVMIVPTSRVYPTLEDWLAESRREGFHERLRRPGQIVFVSGPSKSADIELNLTLGVHGPRVVHAIIYDDTERSAEQPFSGGKTRGS